MPICKTSCNVYPLILGNPLTKPQNNTNRQWQKIEFLINNILYIQFLDGLAELTIEDHKIDSSLATFT
jgi:hypothetical protein